MRKILIFIILLIVPSIVEASDYNINNFYVDAKILENGDLEVKELVVLNGNFNGYVRELVYENPILEYSNEINFANSYIYNADGIFDVKISAKKFTNVTFEDIFDTNYLNFEEVSYATNGDIGKYELTNLSSGASYKMYYPGDYEKVGFLLEYTVENVVVIHNDVAELYWNFIGNGFNDEIDDILIKVNLPGEDKSDLFKIWAHGEKNYLSGEVKFIDDSSFSASIMGNVANSAVDVRTTFDKTLIKDQSQLDNTGISALDEIIKVETEKANESNELRESIKFRFNLIQYLSYAAIIGIIILWVYVYIKFDKERKSSFYSKYYREFIEDYNVEVIDYLMNKKITANAFTATITNLIYKKNIKAEKIKSGKDEYLLTLMNTKNINKTEENIIDLLFKTISEDKKTLEISALKEFAKNTKTCQSFMASYNIWKGAVEADGVTQCFFEEKNYTKYGSIPLVITICLLILAYMLSVDSIIYYIPLILSICFFIYTSSFSKKTVKGLEHYKKWKAFKDFLNDFGTFEEKDLPQIILWEKYLVYASIFGITKKLSKTMKVKLTDMNSDISLVDTYIFYSVLNSSVSTAVTSSTAAVNAINAASSNSSGLGGGGGFSGGGGFGGGGGGGGGF